MSYMSMSIDTRNSMDPADDFSIMTASQMKPISFYSAYLLLLEEFL